MPNDTPNTSLATILVIDDAQDIRLVVSKILSGEFNIIEASNGKDGWEKIQQQRNIQLILTDLDMPEMNGCDVINLARNCDDENIRNLPIIMLTSTDENESSKEQALNLGATEFLTKPINTLNLLASVRAHTQYQQTNKALQDIINVDTLTGLLNKKGFEEQLEKDISMAARHEQELSIFTVHLNLSNDLINKLGRASTDKIIIKVASVLVNAIRKEDTVAREGITTFMMSLPTAKPNGAMELAKRICAAAAKNNITFQQEAIRAPLLITTHTAFQIISF